MIKLQSKLDNSINFVESALEGFLESRYVRKVPEYFICYLSSQSGCNRGCKFCHLTATKQTKFENSLPVDYLSQASRVLKHYIQSNNPAQYINYNFMARGEALDNPSIVNNSDEILFELGKLANSFDQNLSVRFNVSTILPKSLNVPLTKIFKIIHPTIYYSFYSANPEFRKHWMPNAIPVDQAMELLKEYQIVSKKNIKMHHCFIEGQNDSVQDVHDMIDLIAKYKLNVEFNLVRYNPYSELQGKESSDTVIARNMAIISKALSGKVQIIDRVGFDVKSSCGMFVDKMFSGN